MEVGSGVECFGGRVASRRNVSELGECSPADGWESKASSAAIRAAAMVRWLDSKKEKWDEAGT